MKKILSVILSLALIISALPYGFAFAAYEGDSFIISAQELIKKGDVIDGAWEYTEYEGQECVAVWGAKTRETTGSPVIQYKFSPYLDIAEYRFMVIDYYRTGDFSGMTMKMRTLVNGGSNFIYTPINFNGRWHKSLYEMRAETAVSEQLQWFQYKPFGESATLESTKDERFYVKSISFYKENPFNAEEQAVYETEKKEYDEYNKNFFGEKEFHADFSHMDGLEKTGELLSDPGFENISDIKSENDKMLNLTTDPGFDGAPIPELNMSVGGAFEHYTEENGNKCIKVKDRTSNLHSFGYDIADILNEHGQGVYKMSVDIRCDTGAKSIGNNYYFSSKIKGTNDVSTAWQGLSTKMAASWVHHEVTMVAMWNGDVASARMYVEGSVKTDTSDYYIDNFELYKISGIVTDPDDNSWFMTSDFSDLTTISEGAMEGNKCIKLSNRADSSTGIAQNITNALNKYGPGHYSVSAHIKADPKSLSLNKPYIIHIRLASDGGTTIDKRIDYYMSEDWQQIYFVFDLQWKGKISNALFYVRGYDANDKEDFYIDNCSMFKYIKNDYTEKHIKYMEGYEDGTFKPDANITRAEAVHMVSRLITDVDKVKGFETKYTDVSSDTWYKNSVAFLERIGVLNMFDGNKFYPDKNITRAELASLVRRVSNRPQNIDASFTDIAGNTFEKDIITAAKMGIVKGYDDNTFKPENCVTRAEAVTMINKALNRNVVISSFYGVKMTSFPDVSDSHWAYAQIAEATNEHNATIYDKGYGNNHESWDINRNNYDTALASRIEQEIEVKGEALKQEILNAKDELKVDGTKYYVSNSGNDSNSGLSPDQAWATIDRVHNADLKHGDGVFFERGSTWWGVAMRLESGITYGAYGSGNKPQLFGTARNYADPSCWKKTETPNVWESVDVISGPAGHILFDDEKYTYKVQDAKDLKKNLDFFDVSYNDSPVRLYYDGGNPGNAFEKIYIAPGTSVINAAGKKDIRVDNLCVRYTGWHGFQTSDVENMHITNCEVGWIGGAGGSSRWGNGIEFWGAANNCSVDRCWVYQTYDTGVTNQFKGVYDKICVEENISYTNNLLDYCSYSFEFFMNQKNSNNDLMKDIYFENNISRYCGYGWGDNNRPTKDTQRHVKGWVSKNMCKDVYIRNNLFGEAKYGTLDYGARPTNADFSVYFVVLPQFGLEIDGNTYVEKIGDAFSDYKGINYKYSYDLHSEFIRDNVDMNAKIALISK